MSLKDERIDYLESQVSQLWSLVRILAVPVRNPEPTESSFDFKWDKLPHGSGLLSDEKFKETAQDEIELVTGKPRDWFKGKSVLDVGCGSGQWSWAFLQLGANVVAVDKSGRAIAETKRNCEGSDISVMRGDVLKDFPIRDESILEFDLVWCMGVLHHTGNTRLGFRNIAKNVAVDGYLSVMVYGEPRWGVMSDYRDINTYEYIRKATKNMTFDAKLSVLRELMNKKKLPTNDPEHLHGYFDAIAPEINDLYSWQEIERLLLSSGFVDIKRVPHRRNHYTTARRYK